jgi:hypothetical protein
MTVFETVTSLDPAGVIAQAKEFFSTRVPQYAAFPEKEGPGYVVMRGQGGEELVIAASAGAGGSAVRGSSILFGQQVKRFFTTLPSVGVSSVASPAAIGAGRP